MADLDILAAYQPILSVRTGRLHGFEALARGRPGVGSEAPGARPDADLLESLALAPAMLEQAAAAISAWRSLKGLENLVVQVNVTGADIKSGALADVVSELRSRHELPTGALVIEITEHMPIGDMDGAIETLLAVKAAGAGLVLDDFGSGYSSLAWLHDLPVDGLKIDGDLTRKLGSERGNVILAATVQLAHALGLSVTAEGVETDDAARQLRAIGVDRVQGFAYGKPQSNDAIMAALHGGWRGTDRLPGRVGGRAASGGASDTPPGARDDGVGRDGGDSEGGSA